MADPVKNDYWPRLQVLPSLNARVAGTIVGSNIAIIFMLVLVACDRPPSELLATVILGFFAAMGGWEYKQHKVKRTTDIDYMKAQAEVAAKQSGTGTGAP